MSNLFSASLIIYGALIIAASVIVNGNPVVYLGIALLGWGIGDALYSKFNDKKK